MCARVDDVRVDGYVRARVDVYACARGSACACACACAKMCQDSTYMPCHSDSGVAYVRLIDLPHKSFGLQVAPWNSGSCHSRWSYTTSSAVQLSASQ